MYSSQTHSIKSIIVLTLTIGVLSACTSGLLIRNLDWLVERYIDDYFDVTDDQSELLSQLVDDSAQYSAAHSIPALIAILDQAVAENAKAELHDSLPNLVKAAEALGDQVTKDNTNNLIRFALTVTAAQREQIAVELQRKNRKYAKKYIDPGQNARRKVFEKDVRRYASRWLGHLNSEQQANLQRYVEQYRLDETEWMSSRTAWQTEFLHALALPSREAKRQRLQTLINNPDTTFSEQQREDAEFNTELSIRQLQAVIRVSSEQQRARIEKQLLKLRRRISGFQQALGQG